ncbi:MAG: VOC family protein [Bryobacteraceae bacterium]|jgi:methylmalonyl-CoA/ethylmalonyl-CoA epimerase
MLSPSGLSLHHIGCVVDSIEAKIEGYRVALGSISVSQIFEDPIQRSRVVFLNLPGAGPAQFELIQPASPDSPVAGFLEKGGGLHHICYEVDDLRGQIQWMKSQKAVLIRSPKPAVAFGGRHIAWMRTADALLIEYLECHLQGSSPKISQPASPEKGIVI